MPTRKQIINTIADKQAYADGKWRYDGDVSHVAAHVDILIEEGILEVDPEIPPEPEGNNPAVYYWAMEDGESTAHPWQKGFHGDWVPNDSDCENETWEGVVRIARMAGAGYLITLVKGFVGSLDL